MPSDRRIAVQLRRRVRCGLILVVPILAAATCIPPGFEMPDPSDGSDSDGSGSPTRQPAARLATVRVNNPTNRTAFIRATFEITGVQVHRWELALHPGARDILLGPDEADTVDVRISSGDSTDPLPELFVDFPDGAILDVTVGPDCNENGIDDADDLAAGFASDCNENGVPDACEIAAESTAPGGPFFCPTNCDPDCNGNGLPDACDRVDNDCDGNLVPDECDPDCNGNGLADACDLAGGDRADCNADGVPDDCQLQGNDCNANSVPDGCEPDSDGDGLIDACEPPPPPPPAPPPPITDCNKNGLDDQQDIREGRSLDRNENGIPDDCEDDTPEFIQIVDGLGGINPDTGLADTFISPLGEEVQFIEFTLDATVDTELIEQEVIFGDEVDGSVFPENLTKRSPSAVGATIQIAGYVATGGGRHNVTLDAPIPPGQWVRFAIRVRSVVSGREADFVFWLAHLPDNVNQDDLVNIRDATAFGDEWRGRRSPLLIDLNGDGLVNIRDATAFGDEWNGHDTDDDGFPSIAWRGQQLPSKPTVFLLVR